MSKKVFSPAVGMEAVGTGLMALAFSSLVPFAAFAQPDILTAKTPIVELAQTPQVENSAMTLPEGTLVFSQTDRIAVRLYNPDGTLRLNLFNKQTGVTELLGVPVTVESTETGTTYRYAGEMAVEIAIAQSGEQTITLNGTLQQATSSVSGTVFYLPRDRPIAKCCCRS